MKKRYFIIFSLILILPSCTAPLPGAPALPQIFNANFTMAAGGITYEGNINCLTYDDISAEFASPENVRGLKVIYSDGAYKLQMIDVSSEQPGTDFMPAGFIEAMRSLLYSNDATYIKTEESVEYSGKVDDMEYKARQDAETGGITDLSIPKYNLICKFS